MPVCAQCSRESPEGFGFCPGCGAPLAPVAERRDVRKVVTVLFCDLAGSTALGERTDPEALRALMSRYYEGARVVLERHGGTVEKFIGDAVMAVFGVPVSREDDALRAVRAAVELQEHVHNVGLEARIGVNTGQVVAGEGGTLVTGDAVNVAARLEQAAGPREIFLGEETHRLVRDAVIAERVEISAKGKSNPVPAHRLASLDAAAAGVARRLDAPMVGRERERQRLRNDFEDVVATSSCRLFTLIGAAGVGKSRLVADLLDSVADVARVVRGRALAYGEGITYWPLVEILVQLGVEPGLVVRGTPADVQLAARAVLERAADEQPLVVVLDDLHWSESPMLDLVEHVVDWSHQSPIFVLCIARPELLDIRSGWGGGKLNASSLLLEALREAEADSLVGDLLGGTGLDVDVRERILRTAEGNPLFIEELVGLARESSGALDVPPTIQAVLQARLDALDGPERRVIDTAAIEGKVFHRGAVAALTPESLRGDVPGRLLALVRKELVRPDRTQITGDDAYRFRHLLIRDTAYEALPKATRAELHEGFAHWLAQHGDLLELHEIVGYHLEKAVRYRLELGQPEPELAALAGRAAERLGAAGHAAFAREDHHAARNLLGRAVALLPEGEARRCLLPDLIDARLLGHELNGVEELIAELDRGADRDRATAVAFRPLLWFAAGGGGTFVEQMVDVQAARVVLEEAGDDIGVVRCDRVLAQLAWGLCRAGDCLAAATHALEGLTAIGSTAFQSEIVRAIQVALSFTDRTSAESIASLDELLRAVGPIGPRLQASVDAARARVLFSAGEIDAEEARAAILAEVELVRQTGALLEAVFAASYLTVMAWLEGDDRAAEEQTRGRVAELEAVGSTAWLANLLASWAAWLCRIGEPEAALDAVARAKSLARADDIADQIEVASAEGYAWALLGDRARADAAIERATAPLTTIDMALLANEVTCRAALSHAALGDHAKARGLLEELAADADRRGFRRWADRYRRDLAALDG